MEQIFQALLDASQQGATPSELSVLHRQLYRKLKFANYEDMFYINQKVSKEQWQQFRKFEEDFFARIIKLMGSSPSERDPQIVSNLSALTYLSYMPVSSGETAQYWFSEKSDMVTDILLETIHRYITGHWLCCTFVIERKKNYIIFRIMVKYNSSYKTARARL